MLKLLLSRISIKIKQTVKILQLKLRKDNALDREGKQMKNKQQKIKHKKDQKTNQTNKQAKPNTKIRNKKISKSTGKKERRHRKEASA